MSDKEIQALAEGNQTIARMVGEKMRYFKERGRPIAVAQGADTDSDQFTMYTVGRRTILKSLKALAEESRR